MYRHLVTVSVFSFMLVCLTTVLTFGQQISIPRIEQMPDLPQPFQMRDWKRVAQLYDSLVFDEQLQGQYLPVVFFRPEAVNYPGHQSFGLHTAIGTSNPHSGEAINVIPAVVGASLCGIDKSDQYGQNWTQMCQDYFNKRPEENIYLNHPATSSGNDWWYETMPNIFYMQLRALYPEIAVFDEQMEVAAMQWYRALQAMDASAAPWTIPYMNYRAWKMSTMSPLDAGVPEPEAAGAIAWIMYQTYVNTNKQNYRIAAEWALEYLNSLSTNPSYELQLPYGVYTAARMNAEEGTLYDLEKMLNWVFDRGPLRGWGTIVGNWGGYDCSGLVGEANDQGNDYAFMMNGYQHAAALVPMVRYDDRFATAIAKWVLNLANASRLFYPDYLPQDQQDNFEWSEQYDTHSVIGYEALKEIKHGASPYATGDGVEGGWSQTNLMLYGSSHVGYLGSLMEQTNIGGILKLDLLKTDFYSRPAYPTYLYYNPHDVDEAVIIQLTDGDYDLYDALSNAVVSTSQSGETVLNIPAGTAMMTVLIPAGSAIEISGKQSLANGIIIDYNNGSTVLNHPPRVKALSARDTIVEWNVPVQVYCTAEDADGDELGYEWWINGQSVTAHSVLEFSSEVTGEFIVACKVTDGGGLSDSTATRIDVVEKVPVAPEILNLKALPRKAEPGQNISMQVIAIDENDDELTYYWSDFEGSNIGSDSIITYQVPSFAGDYYVFCQVTDTDALFALDSLKIMVRELSDGEAGNLVARYMLDGDANDSSGNQLDGNVLGGVNWSTNQAGDQNKSACLNGTTARIQLPSDQLFNFTEALSITLHFKIESFGAEEQFLVSHGSWQNRYKISISDNRIRFTINTNTGIVDLDSETIPEAGRWYHLAAVYDGLDMELWLEGGLNAFKSHSGAISTTPMQPVIGQQFPGDPGYNFAGCLDNVSIYDYALIPEEINENQFLGIENSEVKSTDNRLYIYPNPVMENQFQVLYPGLCMQSITYYIFNPIGQVIDAGTIDYQSNKLITINLPGDLEPGLFFLRLNCENQVYIGNFLILP